MLTGTRDKLERQAVELLAQGLPEAWLCDRAREMAPRGWSDLVQHAERSRVPITASTAPGQGRPGLPEWCGECGDGSGGMARFNPSLRKVGPEDARELCPRCHPSRIAPAADGACGQPVDAEGTARSVCRCASSMCDGTAVRDGYCLSCAEAREATSRGSARLRKALSAR